MTGRARGTFEVELSPRAIDGADEGGPLGRMAIAKRFRGDLEGSSRGEMLSARTGVAGSAGYVAIERVSGTLDSRAGGFVLQHSGTLDRGVPQLSATVVPDSGTGELSGLAGRMTIEVEGGVHSYELEYAIAETP